VGAECADAFYKCSKLTSVEMPAGTKIGYEAFIGCSKLTSVEMPAVTEIDADAFHTCSALTSVKATYEGCKSYAGKWDSPMADDKCTYPA